MIAPTPPWKEDEGSEGEAVRATHHITWRPKTPLWVQGMGLTPLCRPSSSRGRVKGKRSRPSDRLSFSM